jgi:hypothetical protein
MTRGRVAALLVVYGVITLIAGLAWGWVAALIVGCLSVLVMIIGFGALAGGDWFREASHGRFERPTERR